MENLVKENVEDNFSKLGEVISNEQIEIWRINEEIELLKLMKWSFSLKKVKTMKHGVHNNLKTMKKKSSRNGMTNLFKRTSSKKAISSHMFL